MISVNSTRIHTQCCDCYLTGSFVTQCAYEFSKFESFQLDERLGEIEFDLEKHRNRSTKFSPDISLHTDKTTRGFLW